MPAKAQPKKNLSAEKRARQSVKRNLRNRSVESGVKNLRHCLLENGASPLSEDSQRPGEVVGTYEEGFDAFD